MVDAGGGVYFCGVAPIRPDVRGELWRFDAVTGTFDCIEPTTDGMPNGMGLSPDGKTLLYYPPASAATSADASAAITPPPA